VPLDRAAARAGVGLDVSVGRVEIGLRTLLELRPGDVLRLPTRLDDTLPLGPRAASPLRCALGEFAGRTAVRICPTDRKPA
jgi:flagellar motor switch protein FliM